MLWNGRGRCWWVIFQYQNQPWRFVCPAIVPITGVKTSPGNVYFSNKTPEAAVTVGDAKRNETHANSKKCLFDLLDADKI